MSEILLDNALLGTATSLALPTEWHPPEWRLPSGLWRDEPSLLLRHVRAAANAIPASEDERLLLRLRLALRAPVLDLQQRQATQQLSCWATEMLADIRIEQQPLLSRVPPKRTLPLSSYSVRPIPFSMASVQQKAFHYIGSPRDGLHFGLLPSAWPSHELATYLLTFSDFDLGFGRSYVDRVLGRREVLVLARVHGFEGAPKNSFSFAFSRAIEQIARERAVDLVLTYVNPNVGFTGASYRAANWLPFAEEPATYLYHGTRYTTLREIAEDVGVESGPSIPTGDIRLSREPLLPLRIYAFPVSRHTRAAMQAPALTRVKDDASDL